ncbi:hypothetical protein JHK82_040239 [Glycine max]|nr:hypothetical protein JHK86_040436 [Glycine max]KAG4966046.1 hypothetical protein JHK85_041021 [Glycine max]KAG5111016.1 hypothetical protein JHK82_040239 [Glycine max]KAG5122306.1 hypothetical protein JHK84_040646 [Glycine max]
MIGIGPPDLREQFGGSAYDCDQEREDHDLRKHSIDNIADAKGGSIFDEETQLSDHDGEESKAG